MLRTVLFVILGISAGFAFATFLGGGSEPLSSLPRSTGEAWSTDPVAFGNSSVDQRFSELETALAREVAHREALEADLAALNERMAQLASTEAVEVQESRRDQEPDAGFDREEIQERIATRFGGRGNNNREQRANRLVEAGFPPDQAQRIIEREPELRLEALNAQYDAAREGKPFDPRDSRFDPQQQLRDELGETGYETYLEATGQSTSVGVQQVMAVSPGQAAGLQPGDELIAYGGQRVFDTGELNELILDGTPGETVVVDVLRDGQQIQVYVPRGPIGITGGRGGGRGGR
ncbi:MAG: PDZ domain-containing protein [Candidatus Rariloculaceae bacterium]